VASDASTKILFIGDMHLGQRPVVTELESSQISLSAIDLGPHVAWNAIVDRAIAESVDAVALAGDLIDGDDDLFEGRALLEEGIKKLTQAGIAVCAVAGNHDTLIMPLLAQSIPHLKLLGPNGQWSEYFIKGSGADVRLAGWSFPARHHATSPLSNPAPAPLAGVVTFGLLHCDLGSSRSQYAPVSVAELQKTEYQAWFLGHIHKPHAVPDFSQLPASPFYLGSITGVDRTETGVHGPVLVSVAKDGAISGRRLPLAPLHWDFLDVPVGMLFETKSDMPWDTRLRNHLMTTLDNLPQWEDPNLDHIQALGLSITLTGEVAEPHRVTLAMEKIQHADHPLAFPAKGRSVFIRKLTNAVTGLVDLNELAERADPPGLLARQILILGNPEKSFSWTDDTPADAKQLLALGRKELRRVALESAAESIFSGYHEPDDAEISQMMIRSGNRLLDGLLEQGRGNNASS
jgi:DNA repair protein SbcD/Mre11